MQRNESGKEDPGGSLGDTFRKGRESCGRLLEMTLEERAEGGWVM